MVNGAYGKGKESKKAIFFQPLNLVDIVFYKGSKDQSLGRLKEVSLCPNLLTIHFHSVKRAIALFVGEVIYRTVREEESNPQLYSFIENSILTLDSMTDGVQNFHIIFLAQLSKYLGFFPSGSYSEETPYFDLKGGVFKESAPEHPVFLNKFQSELLSQALTTHYGDASNLKLNGKQRNLFLNNMLDYYSFHTDSFQGIHSLPILKQVFEE
jgi:DNA repair protein RecO (recombination protein O)